MEKASNRIQDNQADGLGSLEILSRMNFTTRRRCCHPTLFEFNTINPSIQRVEDERADRWNTLGTTIGIHAGYDNIFGLDLYNHISNEDSIRIDIDSTRSIDNSKKRGSSEFEFVKSEYQLSCTRQKKINLNDILDEAIRTSEGF
jgi:hypothetical protein